MIVVHKPNTENRLRRTFFTLALNNINSASLSKKWDARLWFSMWTANIYFIALKRVILLMHLICSENHIKYTILKYAANRKQSRSL